jgi:hypothetical protein
MLDIARYWILDLGFSIFDVGCWILDRDELSIINQEDGAQVMR